MVQNIAGRGRETGRKKNLNKNVCGVLGVVGVRGSVWDDESKVSKQRWNWIAVDSSSPLPLA
jgi:hypothetical protein